MGKVYRKIRFAAIYIFAFCLMAVGNMHYVDVKGDSFGNIFVFAGFNEKKPLPIRPEKSIYGRRYHLRGLTSKGAGIYGNEENNRAAGYVLSAIEEAGIDSAMTDYDKVAAINQYLCEKLSYAEYAAVEGYPYEKNWLPFTDYCLLSNTAVCAGYAEAFQSMCCTLGIECWYVTGNISPEGKLSDALSTALFVMGAKEAETYWRKQGGFDMILISDEGEILLTEGIEKYFLLGEGQNLKIRVLVK